jgi:hypothetical protein
MSRFRKLILTLGAVAVITGMSAKAQADTITIVGVDTGQASTATVTCELVGNTFMFTVTNTSPSGSTITGIGFDLVPGDFDAGDNNSTGLDGFTGSQANAVPIGSSVFSFSDAALGNVPHGFGDTVVLDFGFITGSTFAGGNPNSGISPGESATFSVTSALFANMTEEEICNAIFVRFQSVPTGEGSDVGVPNAIPEPSSMLLLGSALIGLGGYVRRRRMKP